MANRLSRLVWRSMMRLAAWGGVLAVWGALSIGLVPVAQAATYNVDRTDDTATATACDDAVPNDCSLRGAIIAANALAGADIINVPAGTYTLTIPALFPGDAASGDLNILTGPITINGAGAATTIIQACTIDQKTAPCPAGQGINDRVFTMFFFIHSGWLQRHDQGCDDPARS